MAENPHLVLGRFVFYLPLFSISTYKNYCVNALMQNKNRVNAL